jgi:lipoprotein Spr
MNQDYAARARAFLGVRFRPQGRLPQLGLDCVGLVICTFGLPPDLCRRDYRLRGTYRSELLAGLGGPFRRISPKSARTGDVLVLQVARDQMHLAVATGHGFVHADAKLGRVVETAGALAWPITAVFRRRSRVRGHA